jgi:hypothetical protein
MQNKIRLLKNSTFVDTVKNPLLSQFDFSQFKDGKNQDIKAKCEKIIADEKVVFSEKINELQILKQKMISLGMNSIYFITDECCTIINNRINELLQSSQISQMHFLDKLFTIFVSHLNRNIIDKEFGRLKDSQAIAYYKMFFENRKKSLKENIALEVKYFQKKASSTDSRLYIGASYGEIPYESFGHESYSNVYVDLKEKSKQKLVNLAIVKRKLEEDFVSYKLHMFFQLMYDYAVLSQDEYNLILYGTMDKKKLYLVKFGLTINIINRLDEDGQLKNIFVDSNKNLCSNAAFDKYKKTVDDFYAFELSRFL